MQHFAKNPWIQQESLLRVKAQYIAKHLCVMFAHFMTLPVSWACFVFMLAVHASSFCLNVCCSLSVKNRG